MNADPTRELEPSERQELRGVPDRLTWAEKEIELLRRQLESAERRIANHQSVIDAVHGKVYPTLGSLLVVLFLLAAALVWSVFTNDGGQNIQSPVIQQLQGSLNKSTETPKARAIAFGEQHGYLTPELYADWSGEFGTAREAQYRCQSGEIPGAYKDGNRWKIPWPPNDSESFGTVPIDSEGDGET